MDADDWDQISEGGDSARLNDGRVVWQEFNGTTMAVRARAASGGETEVLQAGVGLPSPSGDLLACRPWPGSDPVVVVIDAEGRECLTAPGIFPHLQGSRLAFLRPTAESHDLVVMDVERQEVLVDVPAVGFPVGSGPVVAGNWVYFESRSGREAHAAYRAPVSG